MKTPCRVCCGRGTRTFSCGYCSGYGKLIHLYSNFDDCESCLDCNGTGDAETRCPVCCGKGFVEREDSPTLVVLN